MQTKVLSEQTPLSEERLYTEKKLVTERPIKGIKNPSKGHDLITGSPFAVRGENHGHGNNVEGIDISNPGGAFYFEANAELTGVITDEEVTHGSGADTDLLLQAMTDPLA